MSAQGDGFTIQEFSADEVAEQAAEMKKLRDLVAEACNIVGIELPSGMSADLLRLAEFLGSQFDCLSVLRGKKAAYAKRARVDWLKRARLRMKSWQSRVIKPFP